MNVSELGSIGEFIGAFGQIIALVYLVIQVRNNTRSVQANTHAQIWGGQMPLWQHRINFEYADKVYSTIAKEELSASERLAAGSHAVLACRAHQNIFNQVRTGAVSEGSANLEGLGLNVARNPVVQRFWGDEAPTVWTGTKLTDLLSPAYVTYLTPLVEQARVQFSGEDGAYET